MLYSFSHNYPTPWCVYCRECVELTLYVYSPCFFVCSVLHLTILLVYEHDVLCRLDPSASEFSQNYPITRKRCVDNHCVDDFIGLYYCILSDLDLV